MIHPSSHIGPGAKIGKGCYIGMLCVIPDSVDIGDNVFIGPGVFMQNANHPPRTDGKPIVIKDSVSIGAGCVIWTGVEIGEGAQVCPGTVVTKDVPAGQVVMGNPHRKKRVDRAKPERRAPLPPSTRKRKRNEAIKD